MFRTCLLILLFFGFSNSPQAQEHIDSLKVQLKTAEGMQRAKLQRVIAQRMMYTKPDSALIYIEEALNSFENGDDPEGYVMALLTRGSMYAENSELDEAEEIVTKGLTLAEDIGYKKGIAWLNLTMGSINIRRGRYTEAAEYHFEGATLAREVEDYDLLLTHLMNLGILKTQLSLFDEASQYLLEAVAISVDYGTKFREAQLYGNLGYLEYARQNIGLSKEYHQKSLKVFREIDERVNMAAALNNLGYAQGLLNEISEAQTSYQESLELYREVGNASGETRVLVNLARLLKESGNTRTALNYAEQAVGKGKGTGYILMQKDLYQIRYELYVEVQDYKKALSSYESFKKIEDSIRASTDKSEIARLTAEYDVDRLEQENQLQLKENQIKSLQLRQRSQMLIGAGLLLLICTYIFIRIRNRLKVKLSLTQKDVQISKQAFELEKERLMAYTQELLMKNESLEEKQHQLELQSVGSETKSTESYELLDKLSSAIVDDKDWKTFKLYFEAVYSTFFDTIRAEKKVNLTLGEQRLAALIKLSLSNKEVGAILNISRNSVVRAKYRLRQKLDFAETSELENYLHSI
ncbi:MAG: transcriptional regulator [Roseivirga sp.]|nr:transcriptional regulator [Roseivirga sp.]